MAATMDLGFMQTAKFGKPQHNIGASTSGVEGEEGLEELMHPSMFQLPMELTPKLAQRDTQTYTHPLHDGIKMNHGE